HPPRLINGRTLSVDFVFHRPDGSFWVTWPIHGSPVRECRSERARDETARSHHPAFVAAHLRQLAGDPYYTDLAKAVAGGLVICSLPPCRSDALLFSLNFWNRNETRQFGV